MTAEIKAALSRLDITAHQQLPFLFNMIREQPRAHWSLLLSDYVVFPLANNPDSSDIFRSFLDHEWRNWVWPFFERDSVGDLLSRQDERTLFTVAMNIFALVHHFVFMHQADAFGQVVGDTFSQLQQFAGWDDEAIMLARLILYASANKITMSAPVLRRDVFHAGWSNLVQFCMTVENFVFFSPNVVTRPKAKLEAGFHIDSDGVFLDLLLVETTMKILRDSLKIETLASQAETDKRVSSRQKQLQKQGMENLNYFVLLYNFFQAFEDGTATDEHKNEIVKATSNRHKNSSKTKLKECIDSFSEALDQQKRNQQLAGAASLARRVYFKVNDTIQVRTESPSPNKAGGKLGAPKTKREMTISDRENQYENTIPILNMNSGKRAPASGAVAVPHSPAPARDVNRAIKDIHSELEKTAVKADTKSDSAGGTASEQFANHWAKLQGAFDDYQRILRLEERAVLEIIDSSGGDKMSAAATTAMQREKAIVDQMTALEKQLRGRADELRTIGLKAIHKREASAESDNEHRQSGEGVCSIQ